MRRLLVTVVGALLLVAGALLLILPGPGLLVVLAGLMLLASEFPGVERFVDPVRHRAIQAAEDSVASPVRLAVSISGGAALIAAGVLWGVEQSLPLSGWTTGISLIASGTIVFGLLGWSYRRTHTRRQQTCI